MSVATMLAGSLPRHRNAHDKLSCCGDVIHDRRGAPKIGTRVADLSAAATFKQPDPVGANDRFPIRLIIGIVHEANCHGGDFN